MTMEMLAAALLLVTANVHVIYASGAVQFKVPDFHDFGIKDAIEAEMEMETEVCLGLLCDDFKIITELSEGDSPKEILSIDGFGPGMIVFWEYTSPRGTTPEKGRLSLNFMDKKDFLLHINPRNDQQALVLNSMMGKWGTEERPPNFPLTPGESVTMTVVVHEDAYDISVKDGEFNYKYHHRFPVSRVNKILVIDPGKNTKRLVLGKEKPAFI